MKDEGIWCYLYRVVDKLSYTVDFLLTKILQRRSAQSLLIEAINNNSQTTVINTGKSGSNTSAI
ncbi:DDE-type integrase/transposase/recombinase [Flavobacterium procerum]|uniref:DDE-type integrase/transposase/recombinase n=1 Tax=Flavobacterium procerum TaxID=1455569 RepID=A0ABV6BQN8_9FLAO